MRRKNASSKVNDAAGEHAKADAQAGLPKAPVKFVEKRMPSQPVAAAEGSGSASRGARAKARAQELADESKKRKIMDEINSRISSRQKDEKKSKSDDDWKIQKLEKEERDLRQKLKETTAKIQKQRDDMKKKDTEDREASPTLSGHSSCPVPEPKVPPRSCRSC